jgi:hypothetical protein
MDEREGTTVRRWGLTAAVAVVALALTVVAGLHAAGGGPRDCTRIGSSPSGVSLRVEQAGWAVAELCVDRRCEDASWVATSADAGIHSFRASVVDPDGRTVEHSGEVTTVEVWPNGEGCGSRRAYAALVIGADGTVRGLDPPVGPAVRGSR